VVANQGQK